MLNIFSCVCWPCVWLNIFIKSTNNKCWRGCGEKATLSHCSWECKLIQTLWKTVKTVLKKLGIKVTLWPSNPTTGHISWENQNWKRHIYPSVHCSTIYNSQDVEATYISINRWMNKEVVVHIYNGILLSHKKEQIWVSWTEMDEPRACYTEWGKSEREGQIPYINEYIWNLERWYWWTYLQGRNRCRFRERASGYNGGRRVGTNWKIRTEINIYTPMCKIAS